MPGLSYEVVDRADRCLQKTGGRCRDAQGAEDRVDNGNGDWSSERFVFAREDRYRDWSTNSSSGCVHCAAAHNDATKGGIGHLYGADYDSELLLSKKTPVAEEFGAKFKL